MNYRVMIPTGDLRVRVERLAVALNKESDINEELVFICVLKGAFPFCSDLFTRYLGTASVQFVRASSYKGGTSPGELHLDMRGLDVENKNVLIVEDIVDTGDTLHALRRNLVGCHPKSVRVASLLYKSRTTHRNMGVIPDYIGFEIPDVFVIGYGLDYQEQFRNLPYIAEVIK